MQRIECINLCENIHKLYQEELDFKSVIDKVCQKAGFNECKRLYIGSYFCGQFFLNMRKEEIETLINTCSQLNIKVTLVIPIITERNLARAKQKVKEYRDHFGKIIDEMTVNDYGMLDYIYEQYGGNDQQGKLVAGDVVKINLGRLLMKDYRDPRYTEYFNITLKPRSFTNYLRELTQKYQVHSIEFDPTHAVIDFSEKPNDIEIALHSPYCYETVGQICQMAGIDKSIDQKFRPNEACEQQCSEHEINYFIEDGFTWLKHGKVVYFKNEKCRAEGIDKMRLIYSPLEWEENK